jgi:hypothetical protein
MPGSAVFDRRSLRGRTGFRARWQREDSAFGIWIALPAFRFGIRPLRLGLNLIVGVAAPANSGQVLTIGRCNRS